MSRYGVYGRTKEMRANSRLELGGISSGPALRCGVCIRSRWEWRLSGDCPEEPGTRRGVEDGVEWVMGMSWTWDVIDGDGCNRFRALSIASPGDSPTNLSSSAAHEPFVLFRSRENLPSLSSRSTALGFRRWTSS
jgi:hypothetical protein